MLTLKRLCLHALLVLLAAGSLAAAQGQIDLDQTFTTTDGSFRLGYPSDWAIHERDDGIVTLGDEQISLGIIPPGHLPALLRTTAGKLKTSDDVLKAWIAVAGLTFNFEQAKTITLAPGFQARRADFSSDEPAYKDMTAAFSLAVPVGDSFAVISAFGLKVTFAELEPPIYAIARTFESGTFDPAQTANGSLPTLQHFNEGDFSSGWEPAIRELESLKLIPTGGTLVYSEDILFSAFDPGLTVDEKSASTAADFVMGGLISYEAVEDSPPNAICALLTRLTENPTEHEGGFLMVASTASNTIEVVEKTPGEDEPFVYETDVVANFRNPQQILYIVQGETLTVFLNGKPIIEKLALGASSDDAPAAPVYAGANLDPGCVMTGVWAYSLPSSTRKGKPAGIRPAT